MDSFSYSSSSESSFFLSTTVLLINDIHPSLVQCAKESDKDFIFYIEALQSLSLSCNKPDISFFEVKERVG